MRSSKAQRISELEKENDRLVNRCALLEIDLTERIEALERSDTPKKLKQDYKGDLYR